MINPGSSFLLKKIVVYSLAEDVDPNVGRFRNLVQTTVIVSKVFEDIKAIVPSFSFLRNVNSIIQVRVISVLIPFKNTPKPFIILNYTMPVIRFMLKHRLIHRILYKHNTLVSQRNWVKFVNDCFHL